MGAVSYLFIKMDPLDAKIVAIVVLAVVSLILGLIPLKVAKILDNEGFWQRTTISALLQFGGGVLFSTCFVHIFPEVMWRFPRFGDFLAFPGCVHKI